MKILFVTGLYETPQDPLFSYLIKKFTKLNLECFTFSFKETDRPTGIIKKLSNQISLFSNSKDLLIISHSLGSYYVFTATVHAQISGIVALDPSLHPRDVYKGLKLHLTESQKLPEIKDIVQGDFPKLIIGAKKAGAKIAQEEYFKFASNPKQYEEIDTDHNFSDKNSHQTLYQTIEEWLPLHLSPGVLIRRK